ncbi:MAG: caspase family protein [Proteobacteria bacterium]|nr:caspase family protein [Pseudomonadota bacterium]
MPIAPGAEGSLYAVALPPSGRSIAVAGHTGIDWDGNAAVYFFNRESGAWVGRIGFGDIPTDAINCIAFSPDGKFVAVATNDDKGLRVIQLNPQSVRVVDSDYKDAILWLDFASDGRLVTSSSDGAVRLYDASFKRLAVHRTGTLKPWSVAFKGDGAAIAVGFVNAAKVQILSGQDLRPISDLAGADGHAGALSVVAWAADGKSVYGTGTYAEANGRKAIRRWPLGGGKPADLAAADDTITDIKTRADGSLVFATAEPAWGVIAPDGKIALRRGAEKADFREGYREGFRVSADGAVIDFGFQGGGRQRARFDVTAGTLELAPPARADLKASAESARGLTIVDWRNNERPKDNGQPIALGDKERARSVAVQSDGKGFVLGTDYFVRFYRDDRLAWHTAVTAPAWVVNVTEDGRFAIAGLGDGTIAWFRLADGSEALSLFAANDGKRWVAWTPEGFFDHGDGGEGLIGYHLNQVDQGRMRGGAFVRVDQLYSLFFRRDLVVRKFLGNADAEIAAQLARICDVKTVLGRGLPPMLRLTEYCLRRPGGERCQPVAADSQVRSGQAKLPPVLVDTPDIVLRFDAEDRGGGTGPIVLRRQGAKVAADGRTRSVTGKVRQEERTVQLEPGLNIVSMSAFNAARQIESDPKERPSFVLRYETPKTDKPVLRLLAVGIDRFKNPAVPQLRNAAADAAGIVEVMKQDRKHEIFAEMDAILLTDDKATLAAIMQAFDELAARAKPVDIMLIFLAGHGVALDGKYYYVPHDLPAVTPESLRDSGLTHERLASALGKFPSARSAVILDTCFSGAFAVNDSILRDSRDQTIGKQISQESGRFILAGSADQQEALDGIDGHGVFTGVLLKALSGAADRDKDGKVTIYEMGEYAKLRVPEVAKEVGQGHQQKPRWFFNGDDMFDIRSVD